MQQFKEYKWTYEEYKDIKLADIFNTLIKRGYVINGYQVLPTTTHVKIIVELESSQKVIKYG